MEKLLQTFVQNEVIVDIKGRDKSFSESTYYKFVTEPNALNFVDDTPKRNGNACTDKRTGENALGTEENEGLCIVNEYAFTQCSNASIANMKGLADHAYEEPRRANGAWKMAPEQVAAIWKEMTLARCVTAQTCAHACETLYPAGCCRWWSSLHWTVWCRVKQWTATT